MHRIRFAAVTGLATLAALGLAAHPASAQTFTFTSGTYSADHLANDGTQGTAFDTLALSSMSSAVTLTAGTPVITAINGVTFVVGASSSVAPYTTSHSGSETFTLGGVTRTITFPYSVTSNDVSSSGDVLQFSGGNTSVFNLGALGQVAVTPQPMTLLSGGTATGTFRASFLLTPAAVPEPSSVAAFTLGGLGLLGLTLRARKRKASA